MRIRDWSSDVCSSDLKTYTGRLKSFREWALGGAPKFAEKIQAFNHLGVSKIILRNLDAVEDSVTDFKNILNISQLEAPTQRRSEERRVWKECVSTVRSRGSPEH